MSHCLWLADQEFKKVFYLLYIQTKLKTVSVMAEMPKEEEKENTVKQLILHSRFVCLSVDLLSLPAKSSRLCSFQPLTFSSAAPIPHCIYTLPHSSTSAPEAFLGTCSNLT